MDFRSRYRYNPKVDLIGKGGFAKVYKAFDSKLEMEVALKLYASDVSEKYDLISEIKKVVRLEHSNICRYFDYAVLSSTSGFGEEEELQVGVMEYLDGGDIRSYVKEHPQHLHKLLVDVLRGLSYLHAHQIIHRDLKPANILIKNTHSGPVAKITDFGISKSFGSSSTKSSDLLGTIEYMAPEQFNPSRYGIGGRISYNLDLWSFGCLTYELLMGESFFGGREALGTEQVMRKILEEVDQTKIDTLPEPFRTVVEQCLIKSARERVQEAEELINIIRGRAASGKAGAKAAEETTLMTVEGQKEDQGQKAVADEVTKVIEKEKKAPAPRPAARPDVVKPLAAELEIAEGKEEKNKKPLYYLSAAVAAFVLLLVGVFVFGNRKEAALADVAMPATVVATDTIAAGEVLPEAIAPDSEAKAAEEEKKEQAALAAERAKEAEQKRVAAENERKKQEALVAELKNIEKKYDDGYSFSEGLGMVKLNGKWGFIDKSGREVIALKYDNGYSFSEGLASVKLNGKHGFIDKSGKEVTALKYDFATSFQEGLAHVELNGKHGFIDKSGKEVTALKYDFATSFQEGLAHVELNGKHGFIDKSGKEVVPIKYDAGEDFSEGLAHVELNGKHGFIDKSGKEVVPIKYDAGEDFSEGLAHVELNGKHGFIDKSGKEVVPIKYDKAYSFSEGLANVELNEKQGFIDKSGKEVIPIKYDKAYGFGENLIKIQRNGKWGFLDKNGNVVVPLKYNDIRIEVRGLAPVQLNGKWGYIDITGNEVIPIKYDDAFTWGKEGGLVIFNGKRFIIDKSGNCVKDCD